MDTEITKSKISQDLRSAEEYAGEGHPIGLLLKQAADAIDELNQRLIDQTASAMERGKKDQEEIRKLNRELEQVRSMNAQKEGA